MLPIKSSNHSSDYAPIGILAFKCCGLSLPVQVLKSNAGYYIGTEDKDGPVSRESHEYWRSFNEAELALKSRSWTQRQHD